MRYNTLNSVHKSDYIDAVSIAGIPNKFQIFFGYFSYFLARIASIKDPQNTDGWQLFGAAWLDSQLKKKNALILNYVIDLSPILTNIVA